MTPRRVGPPGPRGTLPAAGSGFARLDDRLSAVGNLHVEKMLETSLATVLTLTCNVSALRGLDNPWASRSRISRSRSMRVGTTAGASGRGPLNGDSMRSATAGLKMAAPAVTARAALISSSASASVSTYPFALAHNAPRTQLSSPMLIWRVA